MGHSGVVLQYAWGNMGFLIGGGTLAGGAGQRTHAAEKAGSLPATMPTLEACGLFHFRPQHFIPISNLTPQPGFVDKYMYRDM